MNLINRHAIAPLSNEDNVKLSHSFSKPMTITRIEAHTLHTKTVRDVVSDDR